MEKVYKFSKYDIKTDKSDPGGDSVRVTREAAMRYQLRILEGTAIVVDETALDPEGFYRVKDQTS